MSRILITFEKRAQRVPISFMSRFHNSSKIMPVMTIIITMWRAEILHKLQNNIETVTNEFGVKRFAVKKTSMFDQTTVWPINV
jgi:hypothetical protein